MTDPNLSYRLDWAAGQVDTLLSLKVWDPFRTSMGFLNQLSDLVFLVGLQPPAMWVGKAADAHAKDMRHAADAARTARQQLETLADTLRAQARLARDRVAREAIEAAAEGPFPGSNPNPYIY